MPTESAPEPREEKIVVSAREFRWAMASLISFVAGLAFLIAHLAAKADSLLYAGGAFIILFGLCRFRLKIIEDRRDPDKARRRPFVHYLLVLALLFPLIAGLSTAISVIAALVKGESLLWAVARGLASGAILVAGIALLDILGRVARALFVRKAP